MGLHSWMGTKESIQGYTFKHWEFTRKRKASYNKCCRSENSTNQDVLSQNGLSSESLSEMFKLLNSTY